MSHQTFIVICIDRFPRASFPKRLEQIFGGVLTGLGIRLAIGDH